MKEGGWFEVEKGWYQNQVVNYRELGFVVVVLSSEEFPLSRKSVIFRGNGEVLKILCRIEGEARLSKEQEGEITVSLFCPVTGEIQKLLTFSENLTLRRE